MTIYKCICGSSVKNMTTHKKTKKHQKYVEEHSDTDTNSDKSDKHSDKSDKQTCPCGSVVKNLKIHQKSKKHLKFVKQQADKPTDTPTDKKLPNLYKKLEEQLDKAYFKGQYRDGTNKVRFSLDGSFLLGTGTCNALGARNFKTQHNIPSKAHKGVYLKPVEERRLPKWKKELYKTAIEIIKEVDKDYSEGEIVVNFAKMVGGENHYVNKHRDKDDISFQYALGLGDYSGATLRCYDDNDKVIGDFDYHNRICKMDGRLPHELILDNFTGTRYCVIWFKLFDSRKTQADPIFQVPEFV